MYFLYSLGGVTFNKCCTTLSTLNFYSPNFQGFILMKNALNNQVGMLGDIFLWLVANLKKGVIYFIKQALPPNISAGSVVLFSTGRNLKFSWISRKRRHETLCFFSNLIRNKTFWWWAILPWTIFLEIKLL